MFCVCEEERERAILWLDSIISILPVKLPNSNKFSYELPSLHWMPTKLKNWSPQLRHQPAVFTQCPPPWSRPVFPFSVSWKHHKCISCLWCGTIQLQNGSRHPHSQDARLRPWWPQQLSSNLQPPFHQYPGKSSGCPASTSLVPPWALWTSPIWFQDPPLLMLPTPSSSSLTFLQLLTQFPILLHCFSELISLSGTTLPWFTGRTQLITLNGSY